VSDGVFPPLPEPGEDIEIKYNGRIPRLRSRVFVRLPFFCPGLMPICCDRNDPETQIYGIFKRMGRKLPKVNKLKLKEFALFVRKMLKKLNPLSLMDIQTFQEWIKDSPYTEARRRELTIAYLQCFGFPLDSQASWIDSFMKTECYGEVKFPRSINSRHDAFKAFSGPFFKAIEKVIYSFAGWPGMDYCPFIKHVPVADRGKYISEHLLGPDLFYFATDYVAFEASFQRCFMQVCELELYRYMLSLFPFVAEFICRVISGTNFGHMRSCGVAFDIMAHRMSGDMCTSLGNGFSNLMLALFILQGKYCHVLIEGDDGLIAVQSPDDIPNQQMYEDFGFSVKLESVTDPRLGSFCGCVCPGNVLIKEPRRVLQKFGWLHSDLYATDQTLLSRLRAKALSLAWEAPNSPVTRAIADRVLQLTANLPVKFSQDELMVNYLKFGCQPDLGQLQPFQEPGSDIRDAYDVLYGITPLRQLQIENEVKHAFNLNFLTDFIHSTPAVTDNDWLKSRLDNQSFEARYLEYG